MRPHLFHRAILQCAVLLVPRRARTAWLAEWSSELWYVNQEARSLCESGRHSRLGSMAQSLSAQGSVARFSLGSFRDALSLRRECVSEPATIKPFQGPSANSATSCALVLTVFALVTCAAALLVPETRRALAPPVTSDRNLYLIAPHGQAETDLPLVRLSEFRAWSARRQHLFDRFAFYEPVVRQIHIAPHVAPELTVARATPGLFDLLGISPDLAPASSASIAGAHLVLSEHLWRSAFHADPNISGQSFRVGLHAATVTGVVPDSAWRLPGHIDAWLLEPDAAAADLPATTRGFVLAHLVPSDDHAGFGERWSFTIPNADDSSGLFECISPAALVPRPFRIFLFTGLLALLALPATTSLSLGEYPAQTHPATSLVSRLRRWLFLVGKLTLLLPTVYFASLDLAHAAPDLSLAHQQVIQIVSSFTLALFALRWILHDQRRRCPVCLSLLTRPARVGQPSRNFLDWNGTELICAGGHGLLHVPELPTSWFRTQRWLHLDPSWSSLFPAPF